jgi:hypothetical protein
MYMKPKLIFNLGNLALYYKNNPIKDYRKSHSQIIDLYTFVKNLQNN